LNLNPAWEYRCGLLETKNNDLLLSSIDMVIVFTGGNFLSSTAGQVFGMQEDHILPAFNSVI
jgi:hypothetical protein